MTDLLERPEVASAPGTYPVPAGRGRWRLTLHNRTYTPTPWTASILAELPEARNRKLTLAWNKPATFSADVDGNRPAARYVAELGTELVAWRWDDTTGADVAYFRGPITASQDAVDTQSHTLTLNATDYLALLARRIFTTPTAAPYTADQDNCIGSITYAAGAGAASSSGTGFSPAGYLPLYPGDLGQGNTSVNPDGTARVSGSTVSRTVTYQGNTVCLTALEDLSKLAGGFDFDVAPFEKTVAGSTNQTYDALRIFYPRQGVTRTTPALYFPGNVTALTRQVTSADLSNYWRTLGNNQQTGQNALQVYGEAWTADAQGGQAGAPGLWMTPDQSSDQITPTLLSAAAQGSLNIYSVLMPTYTLTLAPNSYYRGAFSMGDTLPLIVQSGRLNVNTTVRVMGLSFEPNDDGDEIVTLTVGRAPTSLVDILGAQAADIRALSRR
jgi:hypothetical protein